MAAKHRPDRDVALAIDTGGTNARVALVKLGEGIIARESLPIAGFESREALAERLSSVYASMMDRSGVSTQRLAGVGHGSAGVPNEERMWFTNSPNMPQHLLPLDLAPRIADRFGLQTTTVLNDCSAGAVGEHRFGWRPNEVIYLPRGPVREPGAFRVSDKQIIPERFRRVCYYTISTGENVGVVWDGKVIGRPELGHVIYDKRDFFGRYAKCGGACKGTGHLEALHSGTALGEMILREYKGGGSRMARDSPLYRAIEKRCGDVSEEQLIGEIPVMLYDAARKGDKLALDISKWHNELTCRLIGSMLGAGYQPEKIAFGGSVTRSMDFSMIPAFQMFADSVAKGSNDYTGNQPLDQLPVLAVCGGYGENHILLGAGASVFNRLYGGDI